MGNAYTKKKRKKKENYVFGGLHRFLKSVQKDDIA